MTTEKRTRRKYTEEFKRDAVSLVTEHDYKIAEAARSLDIGDNLLWRWKREFEEEAAGARLNADEREELKRLRKDTVPTAPWIKAHRPASPSYRQA